MKSIRAQILILLSIVAFGTVAGGGFSLLALHRNGELVRQHEILSDVALLTEKLNHEVTAAVMDSRGIYMSRDQKEVESFAKPNERRFVRLKALSDELIAKAPSTYGEQASAIHASVQKFIEFRAETIRIARQNSISEANAYGNNDANRTARRQLNDEISRFTTMVDADGATASAKAKEFSGFVSTWLPVALIVMLVGSVALGLLFAARRLSTPILALSGVMDRIVKGDTALTVPAQDRRDEIGDMAHAVENLRKTTEEVAALRDREREDAIRREAEAATMSEVVAQVGHVVDAAAKGDFAARVSALPEDGRLLSLVEGVNAICEGIDRATGEFASTLASVAEGDLTRNVDGDYRGRMGELKDAINNTTVRLAEVVGTIQRTSGEIGNAAREIDMGANDLSKRTEEQAASLQQTAATTEELAASVKATAKASQGASEIASQARDAAVSGSVVAGEAIEAMARIETASTKMTEIVRLIEEIAFQTNLLALNAAVEAARAGDAGRGFAVVASEVRILSQKSGTAAKDISALIASTGKEIADGVRLVNRAGDELGAIRTASEKVEATIADISAAAGEQSSGIDEMATTVAHLDEMTQQNAALSEESAASASSLTDRIRQLNELVGTFKVAGTEVAGLGVVHAFEPVARPIAAHAFEPRPRSRKVANGADAAGWEEF